MRGSWPPGPAKISHKKDGHRRQPHRPYPGAGSTTVVTVWNSSCRKAMFSQACDKNSVHGRCTPPGQTPPGRTPP